MIICTVKPYYTDPLKAAWMAQEFGVFFLLDEFVCTKEKYIPKTDGSNGYITECEEWIQCKTKDSMVIIDSNLDKFIIHPDSLRIFEPQKGDLLSTNGEPRTKYLTFINKESCDIFLADGEEYHQGIREYNSYEYITEIILRDGKHFFMPEEEC